MTMKSFAIAGAVLVPAAAIIAYFALRTNKTEPAASTAPANRISQAAACQEEAPIPNTRPATGRFSDLTPLPPDVTPEQARKQYFNIRDTRDWNEFQKQFDQDHDGKLSVLERRAAVKAWTDDLRRLYLRAFDANGDGAISTAEATEAAKAAQEHSKAASLQRYDANHDGTLDASERAAMDAQQAKASAAMTAAADLRRYDLNRDGKLDDRERQIMERDKARAHKEVNVQDKQLLPKYDKDGDGKLSSEERQAARKDMQEQQRRAYAAFLKRTDLNHDGKVTTEEMQAYQQKLLAKYDADHDGKLSNEEMDRVRADEAREDQTATQAAP